MVDTSQAKWWQPVGPLSGLSAQSVPAPTLECVNQLSRECHGSQAQQHCLCWIKNSVNWFPKQWAIDDIWREPTVSAGLYKAVRNTEEWDGPPEMQLKGMVLSLHMRQTSGNTSSQLLANPPSSSAENLHNQHTSSSSSRFLLPS